MGSPNWTPPLHNTSKSGRVKARTWFLPVRWRYHIFLELLLIFRYLEVNPNRHFYNFSLSYGGRGRTVFPSREREKTDSQSLKDHQTLNIQAPHSKTKTLVPLMKPADATKPVFLLTVSSNTLLKDQKSWWHPT